MKKALCLFILFLFQSCQSQSNHQITGEWEKLTNWNNEEVLYYPCDADNREIKVDNNKIYIKYGQEDIVYNIKKIETKRNSGIIYTENGETLKYKIVNSHEINWEIPNKISDTYILKDKSYQYKKVYQPCEECWGKEECSQADEGIDNIIKIKGKWKVDCDNISTLEIKKDTILFAVMSNQIYIKSKLKKVKENIYNLYLINPDDLGAGGARLDWDNFSNDKPIAIIQLLQNSTISFNWLGFYHAKEKIIIFPDCEFNLESQTNPSVLKRCD